MQKANYSKQDVHHVLIDDNEETKAALWWTIRFTYSKWYFFIFISIWVWIFQLENVKIRLTAVEHTGGGGTFRNQMKLGGRLLPLQL
jgi:hypothetical protein